MLDELADRLTRYYQSNRIYPLDFKCPHLSDCKRDREEFIEARMPSVGRRYLEPTTPRVAVISLDPGSEARNPEDRLFELRGSREPGTWKNKNAHWYRTHEIVAKLIEPFVEVTEDAAGEYFAHLNSVKCCANLTGNRQAPHRMFTNCRWYLPEEVRLVAPEVILTQGNKARDALWGAFPVQNDLASACRAAGHKCWAKTIHLNEGVSALWLHTYHPNQPGGLYHRHREEYFACYPRFVRDFKHGA